MAELKRKKRAKVKRSDDLVMHPGAYWSLASIARVIEYSVTQTTKIVCQPDFPRPTYFFENGHPRWKAGDVLKWLDERGANLHR